MRGSYGIVFVLVLLSFLVQASAPDGDFTRLVIIWLQGATLVFAVRIARADQRPIRLAAAVALLVGIAAPDPVARARLDPRRCRRDRDRPARRGRAPGDRGRPCTRHAYRRAGHRRDPVRRSVDLSARRDVLLVRVRGRGCDRRRAVLRADRRPGPLRLPLLQLHDAHDDRLRRLHRGDRARPHAGRRRGARRSDLPRHDRGADRDQPPAEAAGRHARRPPPRPERTSRPAAAAGRTRSGTRSCRAGAGTACPAPARRASRRSAPSRPRRAPRRSGGRGRPSS